MIGCLAAAAFGVLAALLAWAWMRQAAELRGAWRNEMSWRGPAEEGVMSDQERILTEPCGCRSDRGTGVLTHYCAEHDPDRVHTFVVVFRDLRRSERPRSYRGLYADAVAAARRWLEDESSIERVVTEAGEIIAERAAVPFRSDA